MPRRSPAPASFMVRVSFCVLLGWSGEINWTLLHALKMVIWFSLITREAGDLGSGTPRLGCGTHSRPARAVESHLSRPDRRTGLTTWWRLGLPSSHCDQVTSAGRGGWVCDWVETKPSHQKPTQSRCWWVGGGRAFITSCFSIVSTLVVHLLMVTDCFSLFVGLGHYRVLCETLSEIFLQHNFTQATNDVQIIRWTQWIINLVLCCVLFLPVYQYKMYLCVIIILSKNSWMASNLDHEHVWAHGAIVCCALFFLKLFNMTRK